MKRRAKKGIASRSSKILYLPLLCLLLSGCSYYGGQLSCFDFTDESKKNLAHRKAAEKFWSSVRPKSSLSDAHYRLGLHYQQMRDYDKAIGEFNKALRTDRSYCKAFNGIAMTYDLMNRCEPAHDSYEKAMTCAPDEAYVYNNYACSSLLCGNYGKGMELLQKAEQLAASDTRIKNNLKIATTIAIRENLSGFLGEKQPQLATVDAPSLPVKQQTLLDPLPTATDNILPEDSCRDIVSETPAVDPPASEEIAITSPPEISPLPPQPAEAGNHSAEDKEILAMSPPVSPPSAPIKVAIEVSNGNGTTGMAKRSADFLRGHGFTIRSITNAKHFQFEESVIYYKEEHLQAAKDLAAVIPGAQNLEKVESMSKSSIGVRVLLGRDLSDIRFPEGYAGLADFRSNEKLQPAVLTASYNQVDY